jgi:hypothetical protein
MGLVMSDLRAQATATLLADGRVLVIGGYRGNGANDTADLYDPSTGSFIATGKLAQGRYWHTATLLADGSVVAIGGTGSGRSPVISAERWNPTTGSFAVAAELPSARTLHAASLLADGRVLVVGGLMPDAALDTGPALLFDPTTATFASAGSLRHPRAWHAVVRLPDDRVLVVGGPGEAELWNGTTSSFSPAGMLETPRWWATATVLADGKVLIVGGFEGEAFDAQARPVAIAELWDPATGSFRQAGTLHDARAIHAAVLLPDGRRVVVIGGASEVGLNGPLPTTSVELWDESTMTFKVLAPLQVARSGPSAALLAGGQVLVVGGADSHDTGIGTAELIGPYAP